MIQAIFTDVDGTLLDPQRQLSPRTIQAIRSVASRATVVLASSRMPSAMRHLQLELGISDHPLICYNGCYVLVPGSPLQVLADHVIPLDICQGIVARAAGLPLHISLYHADRWYAPARDEWTDREERITKVSPEVRLPASVLDEWSRDGRGAHKIMCMGEAASIASFASWLTEQYGLHIHVYRSRPTYLELATRQASKATGMRLIMQQVVRADVQSAMAFGDNYNDVEMLREAGLGIAVENAIEEARSAARELTRAGREDGVAIAIERHFSL